MKKTMLRKNAIPNDVVVQKQKSIIRLQSREKEKNEDQYPRDVIGK